MSTLPNFPNIRPSLLMDFANSRRTHPLLQCVRGSAATRFNSEGKMVAVGSNIPRIDFDPLTGKCLGLLIEEARTNLCLHSADMTNSAWTKTLCTAVASADLAPDGTSLASKVIPAASSGQKFIGQNMSVVAGTTYTQQIYVKASGYNWFQIATSIGFAYAYQNVDVVNGVAGNGDMQSTLKIRKIGSSGWLEISVSAVATSTTTSGRFLFLPLGLDADGRLPTLAGDGTSGALVWGSNFEAGAFPTSHIPTTTATVTRAADVITLPFANFADISVAITYVELGSKSGYLWQLDAGSASDRLRLDYSASGNVLSTVTIANSPASVTISPSANINAGDNSIAVAFTPNTLVWGRNGMGGATTHNKGAIPTASTLRLGSSSASNFQPNCRIKRISIYRAALTQAQLQRLTA